MAFQAAPRNDCITSRQQKCSQNRVHSTNHVYLHRFSRLRLRLKRKTHPAFRVLNVFYFQTDFNLRFKRKRDVRLTCKRFWCILHRTLLTQMAMPHYIAYYRSNGFDQRFRKLKPKPKLNPPTLTDHRSKFAKSGTRIMCSFGSCQTRFEFLSQFRKVRNAFECFVTNTGANAFAKNQMRLAYEDKRDLYCSCITRKRPHKIIYKIQSIIQWGVEEVIIYPTIYDQVNVLIEQMSVVSQKATSRAYPSYRKNTKSPLS